MCFTRVRGKGQRVLLVHGVAGSALIWSRVVDLLAPELELVAVDLLGYGHSAKPQMRYTPAAHVDAIRAAIEREGDPEPLVVVGLSMGCLLALEYAARYPTGVRAVVNVAMPYYRDAHEARLGVRSNVWTALVMEAPAVARVVIGALWGAGRHSQLLSKALAPRLYSGEMARETMMARYHSFSSTLRECLIDNRAEPLLDATARIPTAFIHGGADRWCPATRILELVAGRSNATVQVVEGAGHNLAVLEPARVAKLIATIASRGPAT